MEFVLKNPLTALQFSVAPSQRSSTPRSLLPSAAFPKLLPTVSCPSTLHARSLPVHAAISLPPSAALPKLYISTVSCPSTLHARSLPAELSPSGPSYFQPFSVCPRCSARFLPAKLSPSYFPSLSSSKALPKLVCKASCPSTRLAPLTAKQTKREPNTSEMLLGKT